MTNGAILGPADGATNCCLKLCESFEEEACDEGIAEAPFDGRGCAVSVFVAANESQMGTTNWTGGSENSISSRRAASLRHFRPRVVRLEKQPDAKQWAEVVEGSERPLIQLPLPPPLLVQFDKLSTAEFVVFGSTFPLELNLTAPICQRSHHSIERPKAPGSPFSDRALNPCTRPLPPPAS